MGKYKGYTYDIIGPFDREDGGPYCTHIRDKDNILVDAYYNVDTKTMAKNISEAAIIELIAESIKGDAKEAE